MTTKPIVLESPAPDLETSDGSFRLSRYGGVITGLVEYVAPGQAPQFVRYSEESFADIPEDVRNAIILAARYFTQDAANKLRRSEEPPQEA